MTRICRTLVVFSLAVLLLLTAAPTTPAQQTVPFYLGIFGGLVIPSDMHVDGYEYNSYYYGGSYYGRGYYQGRDISLDNSWTIGVKGGYIIPQLNWLAVELEYTYLGKQDFNESRINGEFGANNLMVNLLFRYPNGRIHPYVGFGTGASLGHIKINSLVDYNGNVHSNVLDKDETAFATQFIGGVNFEITSNWSAELAYKYIYSRYTMNNDFATLKHIITYLHWVSSITFRELISI